MKARVMISSPNHELNTCLFLVQSANHVHFRCVLQSDTRCCKNRSPYLLFSHACDQPVGGGLARKIRNLLGHFSIFPFSHHFSHFPYSETCSCNISLSSWGYHENCSEIAGERCIQNETPPPSVLNVHCHDIWAQFSQVHIFFPHYFSKKFVSAKEKF